MLKRLPRYTKNKYILGIDFSTRLIRYSKKSTCRETYKEIGQNSWLENFSFIFDYLQSTKRQVFA